MPRFRVQSLPGHIQESTNKYINKQNTKSLSICLPISPSLSKPMSKNLDGILKFLCFLKGLGGEGVAEQKRCPQVITFVSTSEWPGHPLGLSVVFEPSWGLLDQLK